MQMYLNDVHQFSDYPTVVIEQRIGSDLPQQPHKDFFGTLDFGAWGRDGAGRLLANQNGLVGIAAIEHVADALQEVARINRRASQVQKALEENHGGDQPAQQDEPQDGTACQKPVE